MSIQLKETRWGLIPPNAVQKAKNINFGINRDVLSIRTTKQACGCYNSVVKWEKDCGNFEDTRYTRVTDYCDDHFQLSEK